MGEFSMQYQLTENFKYDWRSWKEPVKTLEDLQEALDMTEDCITLWVVQSVDENGVMTYEERKFEDLELSTRINLWGVRFEVPNDEFSPATAVVRILADNETGEEYLAYC